MADPAHQIVRVEGFEVSCRLPRPVGNSMRSFDRRSALIVRVTTRAGTAGWGETWAFPEAAGSLIRSNLAPAILGADATAPRAAQARMVAPLAIDRRGQSHMAIAALDIALWDACGRIAGRPIHALLGGALRDRVPAYASGPFLQPGPDRYGDLAEAVEGYAAAGFRAVKLRVGTDLLRDAAAIRRARAILGEEALLMADLNEGSTVRDAVALTEAVAEARLSWIEEPIPHDDLPGYRRLAQLLSLPLAGGESFSGAQAFRDFLCAGALDIVQPDLAICGGLSEGLRVAALADAFETAVAPHVWGTGINFLASLQFAAVLTPRRGPVPFPLFEYDMGVNPLRSALYDPRPDRDGMLAIPDGPGLGIDISIERLAEYVTGHWVLE